MSGSGGVEMIITQNPDPNKNAQAPRLSTTRYVRYGRFSAYFRAPAVKGVITTFVGMGPNLPDGSLNLQGTDPNSGDELDWEIVGGDPSNAQSNVFYRGFKDFGVRGGLHPVDFTEKHLYTIDWRRDRVTWLLDNRVVRTYLRNSTAANMSRAQDPTQAKRFYPDRAMKIQFALWSDLNNTWAGGRPEFPAGTNSASAVYDYVDIQCYDDNDSPVPMWPMTNNVPRKASIQFQPTQTVNGAIPAPAGPNWQGELNPDGSPFGAVGSNPFGGSFTVSYSFTGIVALVASVVALM